MTLQCPGAGCRGKRGSKLARGVPPRRSGRRRRGVRCEVDLNCPVIWVRGGQQVSRGWEHSVCEGWTVPWLWLSLGGTERDFSQGITQHVTTQCGGYQLSPERSLSGKKNFPSQHTFNEKNHKENDRYKGHTLARMGPLRGKQSFHCSST